MEDKNKKRDPMPPPDATSEEIGEFWDTHSLADYWDETHEMEFQVNLKSRQDPALDESEAVDQNNPLSAEKGWRKLKELIQSLDELHEGRKKGEPFEEFTAALLGALLDTRFETAKSGYQPIGDAINEERTIVLQTKNYNDKTPLDRKEILGDIEEAESELPNLQVYVLAASRTINNRLHNRLENFQKKTSLDIVPLELTDKLSNLGALCVTFWKDIHGFFDSSDICQDLNFLAWVEKRKNALETKEKIKHLRFKLEDGIQTQNRVQKDIEKYLLERFSTNKGFNPINLSEAIDRKSVESKISDWWNTPDAPICCLEGKEGHGKTWIAAKAMNSICKSENIVTFWLDSKEWNECKSIFDLLYACFSSIYPSDQKEKIGKLQNKPAKIWRKTLIVLDGVNERNAIEAAQRILTEYYNPNSEWTDRIRFLFTIRSLDNYPDFESYLRENCHKISVEPFNDPELQEALIQEVLKLDDLPDSLIEIAKIPRYFKRCIELRNELGSFGVVTKEMVLLADLSEKIKHADPQIKQKLGWIRPEDPKDFFSHLAKQIEWDKIDDAPEKLGQLLKECFTDYSKIRLDLEEQGIVSKAGLFDTKLSADHVLLCWALYLSSLFDSIEFTRIEDFLERFQQELEPIPQEDVSTEALFAALQLSAISPNTNLSEEQRSQKRTALMLAWFHSHNAQITDERLSFWAEKDPDAYAQIVEFEFNRHNSPNYEDALIAPLAKAWLNKKSDLNRLASRLKKWLLPTHSVNSPENREYIIDPDGYEVPVTKYDPQIQLSAAALSILSQRPKCEFLETLASCYELLERYESPDQNIGILMRWGYTEAVLDDLCLLAQRAKDDELLLKGVYGLASNLSLVDLPLLLQRPPSKKERETRAFIEQHNRRFKPYIKRIRNQERLLIGDSPAANGNYHGLDYLAVRTDLPDLHHEDHVEIKKILQDVSVNAKLGWGVGATLEDFCIENLLPWVAKDDPESYAELACSLKLNALNQKWAQFKLSSIHGLIFQPEDCEKITEAILGMKQHLIQGEEFYSDLEWLTSLLTETLLFCASEEVLTDWFEFLALHEPLRMSICYERLPYLFQQLLPKSIVKLARQKLEELRSSVANNSPPSNGESKEFSEEEFWCTLYAYGTPVDENSVKVALGELKLRKPDSTGTYPMLRLALSNPKQFLDEMLIDERIQYHLFSHNGRRFIPGTYNTGENIPSYEVLRGFLPPEFMGSFLCLPDRRDDLSRWGKELIKWLCSIFQGATEDWDYDQEMRFSVNPKVLQTWAEQNRHDFLKLTDEYLTGLSKSPRYSEALWEFTDAILCLLLRFQTAGAMKYYRQLKANGLRITYRTHYGVETFLAQLWKVESCNSSEHRQLRRELLEGCLNDEEIIFMTLAALAEGGRDELWSLVKDEYLESHYAKERNLGVSILPWFGSCEAINELKRLKSSDQSQWVREHAAWAYEVAQQERSCQEVYRKALQTRDPFRISAIFEQIKPALSPIARWWHRKIEKEEFGEDPQDIDPRLAALIDRFWHRWGNSTQTKRNIEIFRRKLSEYCRGEKLSGGSLPRIAPWWTPTSDTDG